MKISRNTLVTRNIYSRSDTKIYKTSSSSKSSAIPSKPTKSSSSPPSKSIKKSIESTIPKDVKKEANLAKQVAAFSGKKSLSSISSSKTYKNIEGVKIGKARTDNKETPEGVKAVSHSRIAESTRTNKKKDYSTDKKKNSVIRKKSAGVIQKKYNVVGSKSYGTENSYTSQASMEVKSQRVLNGATINIPSYLVPETKNEKGNFPDIKKVIRLGIRISKTIVRLGQKFGIKNSAEVGFKIGSRGVLTSTGLILTGKSALSILGKGLLLAVALEHKSRFKKYEINYGLKKYEKPKKIGKIVYEKLFKINKRYMNAVDNSGKTLNNDVKTNELNLNTPKLSKVNRTQIDRKLDYLFGKATGNKHAVIRTNSMQISLKKIGIYDNKVGREALIDHFEKVLNDPSSVVNVEQGSFVFKELPDKPVGYYVSTTRESFFMGPNGGVMFKSFWDENKLISVVIKEGKK